MRSIYLIQIIKLVWHVQISSNKQDTKWEYLVSSDFRDSENYYGLRQGFNKSRVTTIKKYVTNLSSSVWPNQNSNRTSSSQIKEKYKEVPYYLQIMWQHFSISISQPVALSQPKWTSPKTYLHYDTPKF